MGYTRVIWSPLAGCRFQACRLLRETNTLSLPGIFVAGKGKGRPGKNLWLSSRPLIKGRLVVLKVTGFEVAKPRDVRIPADLDLPCLPVAIFRYVDVDLWH